MDKRRFVVGIDEVGRGPIAGPVCVCAFLLPDATKRLLSKTSLPLRDSKKLSKEMREKWVVILKQWQKEGKCGFAVSFVSSSCIDKRGIAVCIKDAVSRCLSKLEIKNTSTILLDGSLKAPKEFKNQKTIIKGDEKEPAISLASIVAKVARDKKMEKLAKQLPQYGFEKHVGYGTAFHYKQLKRHGISTAHRKSFLKRVLVK